MQLSSLRGFHWLIIILLIIFNNYEILFQRVFRPRWTCIQCTMQTALANAFGNRSHPGTWQKWILLVFVPFLCVQLLFSGIRHTRFCSLFPPPCTCSPSFFPLSDMCVICFEASFGSPSSTLFLKLFFPVGWAWPSKNCILLKWSSICRLFLPTETFWGLPVDVPSLTGLQVFRRSHIKPD